MPVMADSASAARTRSDRKPPAGRSSLWVRFSARHLHDYNAVATRRWLVIVAAGAIALGAAAALLLARQVSQLDLVALALVFVGLLAAFPVSIPRTKYSISATDVFVYMLLAMQGAPVAVLAAGVEGSIGAWRASGRLTSRSSTPAAAMAGMAVCGAAFEALHAALGAASVPALVALLVALSFVALAYFASTTLPLIAVIAAKTGGTLSLRNWLSDYGWLAGLHLLSAAVAALLTHSARASGGMGLFVAAATLALAVLVLVNHSLRAREREHAQQEARVQMARREAELNQQRFLAAFTHAAIGMAIVRPDGVMHQANHALGQLLGRDAQSLVGRPFVELLDPADRVLFARHVGTHAPEDTQSLELRCGHADGSELWVSLHFSAFIDPAQERPGMIYQLHDITARRRAEGRLQHIAYHDGLTDLANRNCFHERLAMAVERSRTDAEALFAVLFMDLDRFKMVNDSLGHAAGNELLRIVAQRLRSCVRPVDLVARLGGDEFAVLLEGLTDAQDGHRLAQRVLDTVSAPTRVLGTDVLIGVSVGMTFADLAYRTAEEILRDADIAMYAAKGGGRGRIALFDRTMHERVAQKLALEADLNQAIGEGKLTLQFQPIFALDPYRLGGFEALARWVHPTRGPVSPAVFIALAEESGIIEALTDWVVDQGVAQLAAWHRRAPNQQHLTLNINISGRDLARPDFVGRVLAVLQRHGLPPERLTLEITETTLMARLDDALHSLRALRGHGVRLSIDDFGTGYSSLAYLSTLPIDTLKIDRSFVMALHERPQNLEIVRAVVTLGQSLGRKVVAEGIETAEQLSQLRSLGVAFGQGYLLSRPLTAPQADELLSVANDGERVAA
jgi:diguanylate cyclase (GGDEF)-like protein/PAS domain S-box-containing protein